MKTQVTITALALNAPHDAAPLTFDGEPVSADLDVTVYGRNDVVRRRLAPACIAHAIRTSAMIRSLRDSYDISAVRVCGPFIRGYIVFEFSGEHVEWNGGSLCQHDTVHPCASMYPERVEREHVGGGFWAPVG